MKVFRVCCPLIPLMEDGKGYPENYELPKRQRPRDSLNIPQLCLVLRESLLYEVVEETVDLGVVGVLSPYTLGSHVMVTELSPNRYCPGPESFTPAEFRSLTGLCSRVLKCSESDSSVRCMGFNWSPYAWGEIEERGGCQSVMTKFHMMIWEWDNYELETVEIPATHHEVFGMNEYNEPFAKLVWMECEELVRRSCIFGNCSFGSRGLFIPFAEGKRIVDVCKSDFLHSFVLQVELILEKLTQRATDLDLNAQLEVLQKCERRPLTSEEIDVLRAKPCPRRLEEALLRCENEYEKKIVECIYPSIVNRCGDCDETILVWEKGFGFCLVLCESKSSELESGLRVCLHPHCGPGGVAEVLQCYLTRPEERVADKEVMVQHNRQLWSISRRLSGGNTGKL